MKKKPFTLPEFLGEKLLLLLLFFLVALFFTNDFGLTDIQKTAIILAAGVDKTEEGNFNVTAQIAVPQASNSGAQSRAVAISGEGETVAQAFRDINAKTGWVPKLLFCDLIVLGETAAQEDVFDGLGYFLRNQYMSDNCLLAVCEGKAEELFNAAIPTEDMTAFALEKILSTEARQAGTVSTINLKDFSAGYYAEYKSGYMPYIRAVAQQEGEQSPSSGDSAASASSASSDGSGEGKTETVFDASRTALFFEGRCVGVLTEEESFALNLAVNSIRTATMEVPVTDADSVYALALSGVSSEIRFKAENALPALSVKITARARTNDCSSSRPLREISDAAHVDGKVLRQAENLLEDALQSLFETCRAVHCDVFKLLDKLKRYETRYYTAYKDTLLQRVEPTFSVSLSDVS